MRASLDDLVSTGVKILGSFGSIWPLRARTLLRKVVYAAEAKPRCRRCSCAKRMGEGACAVW